MGCESVWKISFANLRADLGLCFCQSGSVVATLSSLAMSEADLVPTPVVGFVNMASSLWVAVIHSDRW